MAITTIKFRRGPSSEWIDKNPVLEHGEPGYEYEDAGSENLTKQKIGDGVTAWIDLPYVAGADTAPPPSSLAELSDTDVAGASDGYALVYEADSGSWTAQPVGGVVGSWENDQQVQFASGTPLVVEQTFVVSGATFPAEAQASITVTQAMLASANRDDVGFYQQLHVIFLFDATGMTGGTTGSLTGQVTYLGEVFQVSSSISTTTNSRIALSFFLRDAKVGDVLYFRFRLGSAGFSGVNCVGRSAVCYPQGLLRAVPSSGGLYLYQSIVTGTTLGLPTFPSFPITPMPMSYRMYDGEALGINSASAPPESNRPRWFGQMPFGIHNTYGVHDPVVRVTSANRTSAAGSPWSVDAMRAPATVQFDRIALPQPPL